MYCGVSAGLCNTKLIPFLHKSIKFAMAYLISGQGWKYNLDAEYQIRYFECIYTCEST